MPTAATSANATIVNDGIDVSYLAAWRAVTSASTALNTRIEVAFANADLPPLAWYEALSALEVSEDNSMRMSDLAEQLTISRGGMTKLVDRLVAADLINRVACPTDRRVSYAHLAPAGEDMLEAMRPIFTSEIHDHFSGILDRRQAEVLQEILGPVTASACRSAVAACDEADAACDETVTTSA